MSHEFNFKGDGSITIKGDILLGADPAKGTALVKSAPSAVTVVESKKPQLTLKTADRNGFVPANLNYRQRYRHFKTKNTYRILGCLWASETDEWAVSYRAEDGGMLFAVRAERFFEQLPDGQLRFAPLLEMKK